MKRLISLSAFLILISGELFSQAADYIFSSSTGTYSEIIGTVATSAVGDDGVQTLPIGFTFNYCGTAYTDAIVCVNGWLELGTTYAGWEFSNILATTVVKPIIAGLWDDLCVNGSSSDIRYTTQGSSPSRIFIVQWKNIKWQFCNGAQENFQIRLYESSDKIEIIYGTMNTPINGPSASIGMNDQTGGSGHFLSVTPGAPPTVNSTTANNNITAITYLPIGLTYTFLKKLKVQPNSLDCGYAASGSSTDEQTYELSGNNLTEGPIVVTAPAGFEVSLNGSTWFETVNVTYTPPVLDNTTIYARFSPTGSPADYSGNITNTGGGDSKNVEIMGTSRLCAAGADYCGEHIGRVQVGTIDNSSECSEGGYADYFSFSTNMYKTVGYSITVTNPAFSDDDACGIWADWNMDGDLYDDEESITISGGPEVFTATITPPSTAVEGNTPLRIRVHYPYMPSDPCGNGGDGENSGVGEVEDYTINLLPAPASPTFSITPAVKKFADCPLGNFSFDYYTQTFTVQNIGPGTLTISDVFLTGGDDTQFVLSDPNTYPVSLNGTSTIQFTVRFAPTTIGLKATTLRIQSSAKSDHDVALSGAGIVNPPLNLSGVTTPENTNQLTWDPPLPEGEIKYDKNVIAGWYSVSDPSSATDYLFTRFTAPVNGNLDYIALFQYKSPDSANWAEIMVCPEDGTTNTPDLVNPIAIYTDVTIDSITGAWKILPLVPSIALTAGTDFFLVTHWIFNRFGPYVAGTAASNSGRSGITSDGTNWTPWSGTLLMRAFMSTSTGRSSLSYTVLKGDSETSLADYITGITATNYIDGGISPLTAYSYGITALYPGSQQSDTSNTITLTTPECNACPLPFTQNFDAVIAPAIPGCMTVTNNNNDAYPWNTSATNSRSVSNCMFILFNSALAMDDWFFTPQLTLAAGTYNVSFWYKGSGTTSPEKLEVKWGNAPNVAGMSSGPIFNNNNITNDTFAEGEGSVTITVSGDYYVGWHGYSNANMNFLVVDDINIVPVYIWTGNASTEWSNAGNWDRGSVPDSNVKVIIPSDPASNPNRFPVIISTVNCNKINIATGAMITVQSPGVLNIINP